MFGEKQWYPQSQAFQPARSVDWRWQRALSLHQSHQYYAAGRDDVPTGRALQFLRAEHGNHTAWYKRKKLGRLADVRGALEIFGAPFPRRIELEARILARQTAQDISRRMDLPAEVVVTYEALFFNVTDRLDSRTYIMIEVIGDAPATNGTPPNYPRLLKRVAYLGGPLALDGLLRFIEFEAADPKSAAALTPDDKVLFAAIRLFLSADGLELDSETARSLVVKWPILQQISLQLPCEGNIASVFNDQTAKTLDNLESNAGSAPVGAQESAPAKGTGGEAA